MNRHLHPDTWKHHYDSVDKPLARFAGQVAVEQLHGQLDFVNEQQFGSSSYEVEPWPEVLNHPRISSVNCDQCQLGRRNSTGERVKQPMQLVASYTDLLYHFQWLGC